MHAGKLMYLKIYLGWLVERFGAPFVVMHAVRVHVACAAFARHTYQSTKRTSHPEKFQRYNNSASMSDNKMAVTSSSRFQLPWYTLTFCTTVYLGA